MAGRKGEKHWRDAVMIAVNESVDGKDNGRKKLRAIADKVVELALDGDMQAIKEIGDRMDGKAHQSVDATVDAGEGVAALFQAIAENTKRVGQS